MEASFGGRRYGCIRGSDIHRDGMYLEITDLLDEHVVLEIFYSDQNHQMTFQAFATDLPLELVEWAVATAKWSLPPAR